MSESPWIRFYPSDWLAGTRGLSAAETGIYITLVMMMYERGAPISNEPTRLARLCGTTTGTFKTVLSALTEAGKIEVADGGLWNRRVAVECESRREKREQASESANRRWRKDKGNQSPNDADAMRAQYERNANQKPEARKIEPREQQPVAARAAAPNMYDQLLDQLLEANGLSGFRAERSPGLATLAPIIGLIEGGLDLHRVILPAIKADPKPHARTWAYLVPQIEDYARQINGSAAKARDVAPQPIDWAGRMTVYRQDGTWVGAWGPKPGEKGCQVPAELLVRAA